jgi:hypothetical protein
MSGSTLQGNFSVGRDVSAVATAPNGTRVDLTGLTDFNWAPQYKTPRSEPLNGPPIERMIPYGHRLKFSIDRTNPNNEQLISQIEQGWWTYGSADSGTWSTGTVYVYITETSGSQTTMQFSGVSLGMTQGGDYRTDNPIKQTIEGHAQRMQIVT